MERTCPNCSTLPTRVCFSGFGQYSTELTGVLELSSRPDLIRQLVPTHAEEELRSKGIDVNDFKPIPPEQLRVTLDVSQFRPDE